MFSCAHCGTTLLSALEFIQHLQLVHGIKLCDRVADTAVPMPPQEARAALAIALAAVRSSAEGRVVRLDEM